MLNLKDYGEVSKMTIYIQAVLWLLVCLLLITGCASTKRLVIEQEFMRAAIKSGQPVDIIETANLSDNELLTLTHAADKFTNFINMYDDPTDVIIQGGQKLIDDYKEVRSAYIDVYDIAKLHWDEYSTAQKEQMLSWHKHALALDEAAIDHYHAQKYVEMAQDAVKTTRLAVDMFKGVTSK